MKRRSFYTHFKYYFIISFIMFSLFAYNRITNVDSSKMDQNMLLLINEFGLIKFTLIINVFTSSLMALSASLFDILVLRKILKYKRWITFIMLSILADAAIVLLVLDTVVLFINRLFYKVSGVSYQFFTQDEISPIAVNILVILFMGKIFIEMDKKLGRGNLWKMITGKFLRPVEEERVFMFVDLKDSSLLAETLGHIRFSQLLQDCFYDFAVVDKFKADVYQYVGDEVVISWNKKDAFKNNNVLKAFFAFNEIIDKRANHYEQEYGVKPFFKAGAHIGPVVITEVGEYKKEITYHGDTMNTASRIQAMCNNLSAQLLISSQVYDSLLDCEEFKREYIGEHPVKGKMNMVKLYKITQE
ncbi:MAG: adenylate/guanylate cyclase domain-containing protein [Flavobacteriales bacterium]|nr:adenylate/guanylate cyclase domain-containing protein [Flavobacteriales bacterium]